MRPKLQIENVLNDLQFLYINASNSDLQTYYSKLALLELCGWLEIVIDEMVLDYAKPKLIATKNKKHLEKSIIQSVYGFDYNKHLRKILIQVVGIINTEKIEISLNRSGRLQTLKSQLRSLYLLRNSAAHTSIAGVMPIFNAPSIIINFLNSLYPALEEVENQLNLI